MVLGVILSAFYALALRKETWSAKQSLIVRDDLLGQSYKPGQFDSLDSMKSAQETIFEIARKPQVIRNALQHLGPPSRGLLALGRGSYPSEEVIEETQGNISFSAPNGAEFGQTEVIILNTKSGSRERARKFTEVLVSEIIAKANEVRLRKFQSMESEILQTCEVAETSLEDSKRMLKQMDQKLGEDAGAMVALGESSFRDDPLSREIAQLNLERRAVRSEVEQITSMLQSLKIAKEDPEAIVNISSDLTGRQPALESMKQEMVQQKGAYALLSGRYTDIHPAVESARDGIVVMEGQIRQELANAESDTIKHLEIQTAKLERLDAGIAELKKRMTNLGEMRADSITLFADIKKRTEILNNARTNLAEVQGLAASKNTELLTTVEDEVQVSTRPDGLGKKALMLCGGLGGLMLGMGLVMLMAPPTPEVTQQSSRNVSSPAPAQPSATDELDKPALVDVGLAKAQSGLATSTNVLRDLISPLSKSQEDVGSEETAEQELQKQNVIDARLESFKAGRNPKVDLETLVSESNPIQSESSVEPEPDQTNQPETSIAEKAVSESLLGKELGTSRATAGAGAKIVPAGKNPTASSPGAAVDPAMLVKAATKQSSTTTQFESSKVEIPKDESTGIELKQPEGEFNKMVDKAFEGETKSRLETQTVQLDVLSKVLGGTGLAGSAGLQTGTQDGELSEQTAELTAPPKRGAQIKPRSANIRPVDLARQSEKEGFDRVDPEGLKTADSSPRVETNPSETIEAKDLASQQSNPFLKDSSSASSSTEKAPSTFQEEAAVVPVPDQIRKLSDSIASFARPVKGTDGSGKESF